MNWQDDFDFLEDMPLRRAGLIGALLLMVAVCISVVLIHALS